jgi:23S rRNA pseudouridine1911/1915/1917 synthase
MPTAPLLEGEEGTLVGWFACKHEESLLVRGRKPVEQGLIHRLDTATGGLVLFAKTQAVYDSFIEAQNNDRIIKTYVAYCERTKALQPDYALSVPLHITSRFRAYGPGRKEVRPLFPGMRGYIEAGKDYTTEIISAEELDGAFWALTCVITRGARHQIRAHLAWLGFPIIGDAVYGDAARANSTSRLELHAVSISFPDPDSGRTVSFSLPKPDRTNP